MTLKHVVCYSHVIYSTGDLGKISVRIGPEGLLADDIVLERVLYDLQCLGTCSSSTGQRESKKSELGDDCTTL